MKRLTLRSSSCKTWKFPIRYVLVAIAVLLVSANLVAGRRHGSGQFLIIEATIDSVDQVFDEGVVSPEEVAEMYLRAF